MFFQDPDELARPGFLALKSRTFHLCCSNSMGLLDMNVTQGLFACSTLQFFLVLKANCAKSRWWDCLHALHCMFIFCIKSEFCEINMVLWHKIVQLWHCKHVNTRTLSTLLRTARFGQVKNSPALNGQWHKLSNLIDCGVKKSLPKGTNFPSFWVPCA